MDAPPPTARLRLRPWRDADRDPFQALSADPDVMAFLLPMSTRAESDAWIDRQRDHQARHGFCFWAVEFSAVEHLESGAFIGSVGLYRATYEAPFTPAVEIGWRLARPYWGQGLALEAAEASLRFGFEALGADEIVANAAVGNRRSQAVMRRLGMRRDPDDDFDHPRVPEGHPLRRQVLYRLPRAQWTAGQGGLSATAAPPAGSSASARCRR